ncbi:hypothetical protein DAPPUDRAFT_338346 [Daphnia pulex]|uniref:Uncharacterized protein n=1 Tax=Daphnia pulex TaxID=6669 RepID=E9I2Q5_DAPPU|nr:hypothetical protein DAPPUDRAFT_338346 [Daphnia pulex]|eukprot:EFX61726.1 hypothetical protein DAPPUDRAFT_338346 [Daphnia pulex]
MAPPRNPTPGGSRSAVKGHLTRILKTIKDAESEAMTAKLDVELAGEETKLDEKMEHFKKLSVECQKEMTTDNGANQQDLDAEYDSVNQMEDEVRAGKNIIILKRQEWKDFKEEERVKEAERRRRQERKDDDDARDQKMQDFMQRILAAQASTTSTSATTSTTSTTTPAQTTRLPQRQIKPFKGDILEWTPFWESFNAAIHSSSIAAVQKFDYLNPLSTATKPMVGFDSMLDRNIIEWS